MSILPSPAARRLLCYALLLVLISSFGCHQDKQADDADDTSASAFTSNQVNLGGQRAWRHDEGDPYGYYFTFDAFEGCGPSRKIHVLVPRDYDSTAKTYPVIYMNDGNTAFWKGGIGGRSWNVTQTLGGLGDSIDRPLVVALEPNDRNAEYTYASWAPLQSCCGLVEYAREVATCVKPWFDKSFRTRSAAASNTIVGSSHGGLASFWIATRYPSAFGAAAALSPSFWAGVDRSDLRTSELVAPAAGVLNASSRPKLWIDWGLRRSEGYQDSVVEALAAEVGERMVGLLRDDFDYGPDALATFVDPIGGHDEDAWAYRFRLFVSWRLGK